MMCPKQKIKDLVQVHELEKMYANNALVNKYFPQTVKKDKKKKALLWVLAIGTLAALAGAAYHFLKNKEDFYADDFFFDDDEDFYFDEEEFDELEEDFEEEFDIEDLVEELETEE